MHVFKFKISWVEDDNIQRDIEIKSSQTYGELHSVIKTAFALPNELEGKFYVSNEAWVKGQALCTLVQKNIKGAVELSCNKTPIGALVNEPNQRFIYLLANDKEWHFYLELILINKETAEIQLPRITRTEGLSPSELMRKGKEILVETEERFDLESNDGFGNEGEDGEGLNEEVDSDVEEENHTDFID